MEEIHLSNQRIIRKQSTTTPGGATRCLGAILGLAQDRKGLGLFRKRAGFRRSCVCVSIDLSWDYRPTLGVGPMNWYAGAIAEAQNE